MEIKFKNHNDTTDFVNSIVIALGALDSTSPDFEKSKKFLLELHKKAV